MTAAAFSPDAQILAIGHTDGTIGLWSLAEGKKKRTLRGHSALVLSLRFTPDGKTLVSSSHDGTIRLWNPDWERARQIIALGPANQRLVMDLDPSGQYLLAAGDSPLIYVLRLTP
jgi:WD40 repeat protein